MVDTNLIKDVVNVAESSGIFGQYQGLVIAVVSFASALFGYFAHRSAAKFGANNSK